MTLLIQVVVTIGIAVLFDYVLQSKVQQVSIGAAKVSHPLPYKFGGPLTASAMFLYLIPLNLLIYMRPAGPNLLFWIFLVAFGVYALLAGFSAFHRLRKAGDADETRIDDV